MAAQLSEREQQAIELMASGHNVKTAANALGLSPWTIKDYLTTARLKLGAKTTAQAAVMVALSAPR